MELGLTFQKGLPIGQSVLSQGWCVPAGAFFPTLLPSSIYIIGQFCSILVPWLETETDCFGKEQLLTHHEIRWYTERHIQAVSTEWRSEVLLIEARVIREGGA